ncbi:unnamed protein product [Cyclocybe aegerita]|uniref:Tetraspanin Tsp2 n=1 Tax=Cyclocybe aegerita TaxID=1973307 RepID=A0A8S0XNZ3_CYCAE|nr:unnamed protein product [Cyclocybe aegerita]
MQYQAPSSARTTTGSSVRRRSSGAQPYSSDRSSSVTDGSGCDDSYPNPQLQLIAPPPPPTRRFSRSQPLPPALSERTGEVVEYSRRSEDSASYHVYSSVSGFGESDDDEDRDEDDQTPRFPEVHSPDITPGHTESLLASPRMGPSSDKIFFANRTIHTIDSGDLGCKSPGVTSTTMSVDSSHDASVASFTTSCRFTQKWPVPVSLKYFDAQPGYKVVYGENDQAVPSLEEGQGMNGSHLAKWTPFKFFLFISAMTVFSYGCCILILAVSTWLNTWDGADVVVVADYDILIVITLSASILLVTALIGITGILLNSRPLLAVYTFLLWPAMASIVTVGYMSYKRATFSLDRKLNLSWSRFYTNAGKQIIQDSLHCCGFYSSMHEAAPTKRCYLRTPLPGCKAGLFNFQHESLQRVWKTAFSLAGLHLVNMVVALLCANHVTTSFGKGLTPRQYRLSPEDVKADAEKIINGVNMQYNFPTLKGQTGQCAH